MSCFISDMRKDWTSVCEGGKWKIRREDINLPAIILACEDGTVHLKCLEAWHEGVPCAVIQNTVAGILALCWHHLHHPQSLILIVDLKKHNTPLHTSVHLCVVIMRSQCNTLTAQHIYPLPWDNSTQQKITLKLYQHVTSSLAEQLILAGRYIMLGKVMNCFLSQ